MFTAFIKVGERWYYKTGEFVVSENHTFDDEVIDIVTGEKFGYDEHFGLSKILWYSKKMASQGALKRIRRRWRIDDMCAVHWDIDGFKWFGKNRHLRRRIWPNAKYTAEFNEFLPF